MQGKNLFCLFDTSLKYYLWENKLVQTPENIRSDFSTNMDHKKRKLLWDEIIKLD